MDARYLVQQRLPFVGDSGQQIWRDASVLIIGAGGLGCPVLTSLAGAGIGHLGIVDNDVVEWQNLHRQTLYTERDTGRPKAEVAKERLFAMNSEVTVSIYPFRLDSSNAQGLVQGYDIVVDASDNFETRYCLSDACYFAGKPLVAGALYRTEGQVMLLNFPDKEGRTPNYRDIFPLNADISLVPDCSVSGVLPTTTALIGHMQANEVLMALLNKPTLTREMLVLDTLRMDVFRVGIGKRPDNPLYTGEITDIASVNYSHLCGSTSLNLTIMANEYSVYQLHQMMNGEVEFELIDVREITEAEIVTIGGRLIPMSEIADRVEEIPRDKKVVIYCRSGIRSANVIRYLEEQYGYTNLYNLRGGVLEWIREIDPGLNSY